MANPNNMGTITGRVAGEPFVGKNPNGSTTVKFTVYADRNFKNKTTGERDADPISVVAFVNAGTDVAKTPFGYLHKGTEVALQYTLRANHYKKADGTDVYENQVLVEDVVLGRSKRTEDENQPQAAQPAEQAQAPVAETNSPVPF